MAAPRVVVIAGPNGAGKSTSAPFILRNLGIREFVNADTIARGLSELQPDRVAIAAGRIMLTRLQELADAREDFAFETTLASRSFASWIAGLRVSGYRSHLYYVTVPDADTAVTRVRGRVAHGGHDVPEETIRRRFERSLHNFFHLYLPVSDEWRLVDNREAARIQIIAKNDGDGIEVFDENTWNRLRTTAHA